MWHWRDEGENDSPTPKGKKTGKGMGNKIPIHNEIEIVVPYLHKSG
jgi:hypothetical protein